LPEEINISVARLYLYYTWSHNGSEGAYPEMEVLLDGNPIVPEKEYSDRKGEGSYDYPSGTHAFNVASYVMDDESVINITNSGDGVFSINGAVLLLIYEKAGSPKMEYWINEGADMIKFQEGDTAERTACRDHAAFEPHLSENPLKSPPPEIAGKGVEAIFEFFKSLEAEKQQLNEVKVLLVGDGGAGKKSLVKRLLGEKYDNNEPQTHGINIKKWEIIDGDDKIKVHSWDFGGQEIMHATHQKSGVLDSNVGRYMHPLNSLNQNNNLGAKVGARIKLQKRTCGETEFLYTIFLRWYI